MLTRAHVLVFLCLAACGTDPTQAGSDPEVDPNRDLLPPDAETPPTGRAADIQSWITKGTFEAWACETTVGNPGPGSPHERSRGCENAKMAAQGKSISEYPVGSAAVRELYDSTGEVVTGHVISVHVKAGKSPDTWFWYEEKKGTVTMKSLGTEGEPAHATCNACHVAAGNGYEGHDFVFRQLEKK
ncbi:MAG: hypothetical protein U0174_22870 [Polyangiaceae bacterium]